MSILYIVYDNNTSNSRFFLLIAKSKKKISINKGKNYSLLISTPRQSDHS